MQREETLRIEYGIGKSSAGKILVAKSTLGVCAVLIGDKDRDLEADLTRRFPTALITESLRSVKTELKTFIGLVEKPADRCAVRLDLRGSAFQRQVWNALQKIPCGKTITYSTIAREIGMPRSVRAVASAISANPVAVAIPCHRVIRSDGSLSGYRWGIGRKQLLLKKETALAGRN